MRRLLMFAAVGVLLAIAGPAMASLPPGGTFVDDDGNLHEPNIEAIAVADITRGCNPPTNDRYCPGSDVTRAEMAAFLLRGIGEDATLPSYQGYFSDVSQGQWFTPYVERLFELGISLGYADGTYRPGNTVTRGEMAAFILRALDEDANVTPYRGLFQDVPATAWYALLAERLHDLEITTGCDTAPLRYCANDAVERDQMASFLARALGLQPIETLLRRSLSDRPDRNGLYQVHVIYVLPSDGTDRRLDDSGVLEVSVAAFQNWFAQQTGGSRLRMDTFGERGQLDISFLRLAKTDAEVAATGVWHLVSNELRTAGFDAPNKVYAVYYDGSHPTACGGASWPPLFPPSGQASIMYLQACPNDLTTSEDIMRYWEFAMLHDLLHTLGVVPTCAPDHVWIGPFGGHTGSDPSDLMYSGTQPWQPTTLDIGNDDYFRHSNPDCPDLEDSAFLDPLPPNPQPPPGW